MQAQSPSIDASRRSLTRDQYVLLKKTARAVANPTIVLAPAAKVLVQVEAGGAVAKLDVGQPLGDDVEKGSVQANGGADDGHDNPALSGIIGLSYPLSPVGLAAAVETGLPSSPPRLSAQLLPRSVLYPVFRVHHTLAAALGMRQRDAERTERTDGGEILGRRLSVVAAMEERNGQCEPRSA